MKTIKIYSLSDPRTNEIRYVGKTDQRLCNRLAAHMREVSSCHRVHWLNQLKKEGLKPIIEVLEEVQQGQQWQDVERFWIKHLRLQGCRLTNNTSGGDGVPDLPPETRLRISQTWIGRKHTPETLAKLSKVRKGRKHTEQHKQRMKELMTNRVITWGDKVAAAVRKITEDEADLIKKRLEDGELVKDLAKEYGMHRTSISKIKLGTYFLKYKKK